MSVSSHETLKRRAFFQTRLALDEAQEQALKELLRQLNVAQRKAFGKINVGILSHSKGISGLELIENQVCKNGQLTSHQESMVARSAQGVYKLAAANAKVYEQKLQQLLVGIGHKIEEKQRLIKGLQEQLGIGEMGKSNPILTSMVRTGLHTQTFQKIALHAKTLDQLQARKEQLNRKRQQVQKRLKEGHFAHVFGGRHLLKQRSLVGTADAAYANETKWSKAWQELRSLHWLFEGSADAPGANCSVKIESIDSDCGTFEIKIRLTQEQASQRLQTLCEQRGVPFEQAVNVKNVKYSPLRTQSEWLYLTIPIPKSKSKNHVRQWQGLLKALERKPKGRGANPSALVHTSAVSWQVWCKDGAWYASASWEVECDPVQTALSNGVMGLDLNATNVQWSVCKADGSPGGKKGQKRASKNNDSVSSNDQSSVDPWCGRIAMNLKGLSQDQALHRIRHVVSNLVMMAGKKGTPLAVEALDFSGKKASLRYENAKTARMLSGFAYGKFKEELVRCAHKHGVQVLWVDPAWTSVAGGAKYSSQLGLSIDKAAAYCIARSATLSFKHYGKNEEDKNPNVGNRLISGTWVKVATRKEAAPERLKGIWLEELKKAADAKSKAVKKRGSSKDQKEAKAFSPEEQGVWTFWKWIGSQLGKQRSDWAKNLKDLSTKHSGCVEGNPQCSGCGQDTRLLSKAVFQQIY